MLALPVFQETGKDLNLSMARLTIQLYLSRYPINARNVNLKPNFKIKILKS